MATVIGESGAFKALRGALARAGIFIETWDELEKISATANDIVQEAERAAEAEHERVRTEYSAAVDQWKQYVADMRRAKEEEQKEQRTRLDSIRTLAQSQLQEKPRTAWGVISSLQAHVRLAVTRGSIARLDRQLARSERELVGPLKKWSSLLEQHCAGREGWIAGRIALAAARRNCIRQLHESGQIAGAAAEREVIERLRSLPDDYYVLNDVRLAVRRAIRYRRHWLKSAQVDHLVLGPRGIFVIETKHWSRRTADSRAYFDPFEQVARASWLCILGLRRGSVDCRPREVIASLGHLPPKPQHSFAAVVAPDRLVEHIGSLPVTLSNEAISKAVAIMQRCNRVDADRALGR